MTIEREKDNIERILVALDGSPLSMAALRAASELAAAMQAELCGLYVEDVNLLRIAELPCATVVEVPTARIRGLTPQGIRRQMRLQAERAERAIENAARLTQVHWSFRVLQGEINDQLMRACKQSDMVILGRTGWSGSRKLGSTARSMLERPLHRTMVMDAGVLQQPSVLAAYDGSSAGRRALDMAVQMVQEKKGYLRVGIVARDAAHARGLQQKVLSTLRDLGQEARLHWLLGGDAHELAQLVADERCFLVLPAELYLLRMKAVPDLMDEMECPLLLVR